MAKPRGASQRARSTKARTSWPVHFEKCTRKVILVPRSPTLRLYIWLLPLKTNAVTNTTTAVGYDAKPLNPNPNDFVNIGMKAGKNITIFIIPGVPEDFEFKPRVVKEIGEIRWHTLSSLPNNKSMRQAAEAPVGKVEKYWGVAPFIPRLRKWIYERLKAEGKVPANIAADDYSDDAEETPAFSINTDRLRKHMLVHLPLIAA